MALSPSSGFVKPQVWAAGLRAEFVGRSVMRNFATPYDELKGVPGETVNITEFASLPDITTDATEGTALTPEALTSSAMALTVKEAAKAVELTDRAVLTAFGDTVAEAQRQVGETVARRVDEQLREAAYGAGAGQTVTQAANISFNGIVDAMAPFGDGIVAGELGLVINSKQYRDILKDSAFRDISRYGDGNGISLPGFVGMVGQIPVFVSDRITKVTGTPDTYKALLIRGKPLALATKREPLVEFQRDALKRTTVIVSSLHYATGLIKASRVVILVTQ